MILYRHDYFIILSLIVIVVLYGIKLKIEHDLSTVGIALAEVQAETEVYSQKNNALRAKVLQLQSLSTIQAKAQELGFQEAKPNQYIYQK